MAIFKTIHTLMGLEAMASAEATGTPINLTHMAVGDGNGNAVVPSEGQTTLVRELFRAPINRVFQTPEQPNRFSAELIIPADAGGFVLREVGVFDSDGSLFAVGNLPETYKPLVPDGAFADMVVRLEFLVTNADIVTLQIDPNVSVATRQWVSNNVTACTIMPGGTTGQVLKKASNACGDVEWGDPNVAEVVVETIEENQILAAAQTAVTLAIVTTHGLALYVAGIRLRVDEWTPHPTDETKLTLATSYAAGTKLTAVQNEPTGGVGAPLIQALNLADVPDKVVARANLDVFSRAEVRQMSPAGKIAYFARSTAPAGWLKANGAAVSRTAYADLFAAISTEWGAGDGFSSFNLPDLRGEFIRGWDDGRGVDIGRTFGSWQADGNKGHVHVASALTAGGHTHSGSTSGAGGHSHSGSAGAAGGHSHSAGTGNAGGHSHTGDTGSAGNHTHYTVSPTVSAASLTGGNSIATETSSGGDTEYRLKGASGASTGATSSAGSHSHSVSTNSVSDHSHTVTVSGVSDHSHPVSISSISDHSHSLSISAAAGHTHIVDVASDGGTEARPRNLALLACIKY